MRLDDIMNGYYRLYDEGKTEQALGYLEGVIATARSRLNEKSAEILKFTARRDL